MQLARSASAVHSRTFGRGPRKVIGDVVAVRPTTIISDDLKLFATTFAAGFIFVSIFLG